MVWYGMVWYQETMVWFGMVMYGTVWHCIEKKFRKLVLENNKKQ